MIAIRRQLDRTKGLLSQALGIPTLTRFGLARGVENRPVPPILSSSPDFAVVKTPEKSSHKSGSASQDDFLSVLW